MKIIIFYILFIFCAINRLLSSNNFCELSLESLNGINKSVIFLQNYYSEIDFDGLYGYQLLENYLETIPRFAVDNICQENSDEVFSKIKNQANILSQIIKLSKSAVKKADPEYYNNLVNVTKLFIEMNAKYKFLQENTENFPKIRNKDADNYYNEKSGDSCLKEVTDNCTISDTCYSSFVKSPIGEEYIATHQAIYLGIYIKNKCFLKKRGLSKNSLNEKIEKTCWKLKMFNDEFLQLKTPITDMNLDLFLEIIVICGGQFRYLDFLQINAFKLIQKFQNVNGCFECNTFTQTLKGNLVNVIPKMADDLLVRKKRRTKSINGCESHTIGLGAASFGAFLQRFLLIK